MKNHKATLSAGCCVLAGLLWSGCATTTLLVQTNPAGASATLERTGLQVVSDARMTVPDTVFPERLSEVGDTLRLTRTGYREVRIPVTLVKGKENFTRPAVLPLQRLDTVLRIQTQPAGAQGRFDFGGASVPPGMPATFATPAEFVMTAAEARQLEGVLRVDSLRLDGFMTIEVRPGAVVPLRPGETATVNVSFAPIITTVQVITDPEGATVEDISEGGFGYLGETPLNRNFNWQDVNVWADRNEVRRRDGSFDTVRLNLRVSLRGHEDVYLREVMVPIGQQRAFRRSLTPLVQRITFASDPEGVHVYVERKIQREIYDESTQTLSLREVSVKRHLGTTPFTFNMDPNDPLQHGDTMIFEKSGYRETSISYALGVANYHQVMTPMVIAPR